jgi:hypothetical protein
MRRAFIVATGLILTLSALLVVKFFLSGDYQTPCRMGTSLCASMRTPFCWEKGVMFS